MDGLESRLLAVGLGGVVAGVVLAKVFAGSASALEPRPVSTLQSISAFSLLRLASPGRCSLPLRSLDLLGFRYHLPPPPSFHHHPSPSSCARGCGCFSSRVRALGVMDRLHCTSLEVQYSVPLHRATPASSLASSLASMTSRGGAQPCQLNVLTFC